jgi:hypothetical protein
VKRFVGPTTAVLLAGALVAIAAVPAYADGYVGLSSDGRHWSSRLSGPLFSPASRWVPGDVGTRSFWVRDQGPSSARLTIAVTTATDAGVVTGTLPGTGSPESAAALWAAGAAIVSGLVLVLGWWRRKVQQEERHVSG